MSDIYQTKMLLWWMHFLYSGNDWIMFSSFQFTRTCDKESWRKPSGVRIDCTNIHLPILVPKVNYNLFLLRGTVSPKQKIFCFFPKKNKTHPLTSMRMGVFRIPRNSSLVLVYQMLSASLSAWRHTTKEQLGTYYKKWAYFGVKYRLFKLFYL